MPMLQQSPSPRRAVSPAHLAIAACIALLATLGGRVDDAAAVDPTDVARRARTSATNVAEKWHVVGRPGEPPFSSNLWSQYGGGWNLVSFFRDQEGFVHLRGLLVGPGANISTNCFYLPPGYRPQRDELHSAISYGGGYVLSRIDIYSYRDPSVPGLVSPSLYGTDWISLDGITFRCFPSGKNGCP